MQPRSLVGFRDQALFFAVNTIGVFATAQGSFPHRRYASVVFFKPLQITLILLAIVASSCASSDGSSGIIAEDSFRLTTEGIGDFIVGDPFELVSTELEERFGGSDVDSFDETTEVFVPSCGGAVTRLQSWGNFIVLYTGEPDDLRFATWTYGFDPITGSSEDVRQLNLRTDAGIGLGATQQEIETAYGAEATFTFSDAAGGEILEIVEPNAGSMTGRLSPNLVLLELSPTCG